MTTTTAEYWSVIPHDGVEYPLSTFAWNIQTWGDDRQGVPPLRGADVRIPWIEGERETSRVADARTMALDMWVLGCEDDGGVPEGSSRRAEFESNWNTLKRIFHNQGRIFTLRKRFFDEAGVMRTADARGRYADGLTPSMIGRTGAKFTVDVRLADPYFYGDPEAFAVNSAAGVVTVDILGNRDPNRITLSGATGALATSGITLDCAESGHSWSFSKASTAGAKTLEVDMVAQIARLQDLNYSGMVSHTGSNDWFRMAIGESHITPACDTGSWAAVLTYLPAWI